MNVKIKFTEQSQTVAELKQEISRLETKVSRIGSTSLSQTSAITADNIPQNSEMLAEGELRSNLDESDRVRDLQDKVAELKAEVSRIGRKIGGPHYCRGTFVNILDCCLLGE